MKRKLLAGLLTLCMTVGMAVPAFAANNGPTSGDTSAAWVQLYNEKEEIYQLLYSNSGEINTVEGAVYDKDTNTITLTNYNYPEMTLATNEMGDDLKLKLVGENHIAELVVWGFGWGGNLEIIGDGSLTINENKTSQTAAIRFMAEGTQGALKVGPDATVTAYKSTGENTYSAAFIGTTSSTLPFTGKLETELTLTADSGMEGEYELSETVIVENEDDKTFDVVIKDDDKKEYGIWYTQRSSGSDLSVLVPVAYIYAFVKVDGLFSGNEYLAVQVGEGVEGIEKGDMPEGYTQDPEGKTIKARAAEATSMTLLKKGEETFYWGIDGIIFPPEGGAGTNLYSVYKALDCELTIDDFFGTITGKVVVPVEGMRNLADDAQEIPNGYETIIKKNGLYSYFCTNDVIKVSPSGTSTDPETKPGEDSGAKDLTASDTGVSISLTDGVPEGAKLHADTMASESVFEGRPELKEQLTGLLSIYDISVRKDGKALEIKDNPMTVKIPLNDHLKGYKYYQAVYLGDSLEYFDAVIEGDFLVFETDRLSQYAILGSNTPFATSEDQGGQQTGMGDQPLDVTNPQTDDSSPALWITLLLLASGSMASIALYVRKRKTN